MKAETKFGMHFSCFALHFSIFFSALTYYEKGCCIKDFVEESRLKNTNKTHIIKDL